MIDWKLIETLINRKALEDKTDRKATTFEAASLWGFDKSDRHDLNDLLYIYERYTIIN